MDSRMFDGCIVRFVRKDDQPVEEYFYHTYEEAYAHFALFLDDDSRLYHRIEIIQVGNRCKMLLWADCMR